ncbi:MAG: hypothetical protein HC796_06150, partial [Synechococcaceae cyanobacterium RL_1_2]|nr:hypothetical protein [Synechococcaceae cyanobacterium RL_1_2]
MVFWGWESASSPNKLGKKRRKTLGVEARFQALEAQIQDYDQLMAFLQHHKVAYQYFFVELSKEIQGIVEQKCSTFQAVEQRRLEFYQRAKAKQNRNLLTMALAQKRQLLESLVMLDKAAMLMLKKIDLISRGIQKLTDDNELQKRVLNGLMEELKDYKDAVEIQREINRLQQDIAEITEVALNFETYLEKYLGPFQTLVGDAAKIDQELARTVEEIRGLAEDLLSKEGVFTSREADQISESLLVFSVASYQKRDRLGDAIEDAQRLSTGVYPWSVEAMADQEVNALSIDTSIQKLQQQMEQRLTLLTAPVTLELKSTPPPVIPKPSPAKSIPPKFRQLAQWMKQGQWRKADAENDRLMLEIAGPDAVKRNYLTIEECKNFDREQLKTLDQLWLKYSDGKFGLS